MSHSSGPAAGLSLGMVTVDSADPVPLARWWAGVTGGTVRDEHGGAFVMVVPGRRAALPVLGFQRVDDPTPGKNRVHLDLGADDRLGWSRRLQEAGATLVGEHALPGFTWSVLADPQGNQFCLSQPDGA
ncbi:VOC family protein [Cellulomonas endophytica]|uniref:VOC family protein n=1 Tax=Cellulomonas endophytica TaxID=2494735 RepID=UPI001F0C7669|nr:VOC family protein [Cellulomonas endophytica]